MLLLACGWQHLLLGAIFLLNPLLAGAGADTGLGLAAEQPFRPAVEGEASSCWSGIYDYARCCYARNPDCWDAWFTYARCCTGHLGPFAADASTLHLVDRLAAAGRWYEAGVDRVAVNLGAGDGVSMISGDSPGLVCTSDGANCDEVYGDPLYLVYTRRGFRGLAVEADERYREALRSNLPNNVSVRMERVDAESVVRLLADESYAPQALHVLKIDIDSHDCEVLLAVLDAGYRPAMIQVEVNVEIPLPLAFGVHASSTAFDAGRADSGCFGCSLSLVASIGETFGYSLVVVGPAHDAMLVRAPLLEAAGLGTLSLTEAMSRLESCCMSTHIGNVLWGSRAHDVFYSAKFRAEATPLHEKERAVQVALALACGSGDTDDSFTLSRSATEFVRRARANRRPPGPDV